MQRHAPSRDTGIDGPKQLPVTVLAALAGAWKVMTSVLVTSASGDVGIVVALWIVVAVATVAGVAEASGRRASSPPQATPPSSSVHASKFERRLNTGDPEA